MIVLFTSLLRFLTKSIPLDLSYKEHWELPIRNAKKNSRATDKINLSKKMQIPCDKCVNGIDEDDDEGTCGVCSGTAEIECHQCGGSGRVQEFKTKEVTAFETQQNADGEEEGSV